MYENDISIEDSKILTESFNSFINTVREIEKETLKATENKLTINSFTESDLITEKKKNSLHRNDLYLFFSLITQKFCFHTKF